MVPIGSVGFCCFCTLIYDIFYSPCLNPKLVKFQGRQTEMSPKAKVMSYLGYKEPFDRHDWVVDRYAHVS